MLAVLTTLLVWLNLGGAYASYPPHLGKQEIDTTFDQQQRTRVTIEMVWPFGSTAPGGDKKSGGEESKDQHSLRTAISSDKRKSVLQTAKEWGYITAGGAIGAGAFYIYYNYFRRIPSASYIRPSFFRKRSLFGRVTRVGDGDGFHLFHTPGGKFVGWGWLRKVPENRKKLKERTVCGKIYAKTGLQNMLANEIQRRQISVRLAGVDAPEASHFGRPAQPFSAEAMKWLTDYILNRDVRAYIYKRDQYNRTVATVYVRRWLIRRNVGLEMVKRGLATVYEAKSGSEFGGIQADYEKAEALAKRKKRGMWSGKDSEFESPRDYKSRYSTGGMEGK